MVASFGRAEPAAPEPIPVDQWPTVEIPAVGMPVVLMIDPVSVDRCFNEIRDRLAGMVADAVREGFQQATGVPLTELDEPADPLAS